MSDSIGVRVVFGVEVDVDSDAACAFIRNLLFENKHVPKQMFNHFDEYYDYFVLGKGDEPLYDTSTDYDFYFGTVVNRDRNDGLLGCFRQACCLSEKWKKKIVIGLQLTHVEKIWRSPSGVDFPSFNEDMIQSQLSENGFSTDTKMFFILDGCISCT